MKGPWSYSMCCYRQNMCTTVMFRVFFSSQCVLKYKRTVSWKEDFLLTRPALIKTQLILKPQTTSSLSSADWWIHHHHLSTNVSSVLTLQMKAGLDRLVSGLECPSLMTRVRPADARCFVSGPVMLMLLSRHRACVRACVCELGRK